MTNLLLIILGFLFFVNVIPGIIAGIAAFIGAVHIQGLAATFFGFTFCKLMSGIA